MTYTAVEPRSKLGDAVDADDGGSVNPYKLLIELDSSALYGVSAADTIPCLHAAFTLLLPRATDSRPLRRNMIVHLYDQSLKVYGPGLDLLERVQNPLTSTVARPIGYLGLSARAPFGNAS